MVAPRFVTPLVCVAGCLAVAAGCQLRAPSKFAADCGDGCYKALATQIEYPDVSQCSATSDDWAAISPMTLTDPGQPDYWDLSLQDTIRIALGQSQVIRDLGGAILKTPATVETHWDPSIIETDPRLGVDAALSAYDTQFSTSVFGEKNDKALNNEFFGGGTRILNQDTAVIQAQLAKRGAAGTEMALRHYIDYDANNAPSNLFPSAWNTWLEGQIRQPLLQGAGTEFSRINGASTIPGLYNGVLIARVNTDIELTEFESAARDLVSNVENAYWDLYFAYRDLDAKIAARDASLETWRRVHALFKAGRRGGEAEKEAQARDQYYRFQEDVQNALSGRLIDGTRTDNGSSGGTFRASGGVHVCERRLRQLMGLPPSDGRLIRTADEPITAPVAFDWMEVTRESLIRRVELRRQRSVTRRYELELTAAKNYLLPRLDAVGRYRWRGFGHDLLRPDSEGFPEFDNAYANLTSGNFQEWQLGVEMSVPLGYRKGAAAVRNAELLLCRSRAILQEQEHSVLHDAAGAVAEFDRALVVAQTTANRLDAAQQQMSAVEAAYNADKAPLDLLLEAQRNLADAQSRHFRALAEYAVAIKNVHYSKGTLLDYDGVFLSEGGWPAKAYEDAAERDARRGRPRPLNYTSASAPIVARGAYDQDALKSGMPMVVSEPIGGAPLQTAPQAAPVIEAEPIPSEAVPATPLPAPPAGGASAAPNFVAPQAASLAMPPSVTPASFVPATPPSSAARQGVDLASAINVQPAIVEGPPRDADLATALDAAAAK